MIQKYWYLTIHGPKSIEFGTYAQIWAYGFWLITQWFFVQSWWNFIYDFRRPLATSKAPKTWILDMFRVFGQIGPDLDQMWACLPHEQGTPSKVSSQVLVCWLTGYLEIKFHKKYPLPHPLPPQVATNLVTIVTVCHVFNMSQSCASCMI